MLTTSALSYSSLFTPLVGDAERNLADGSTYIHCWRGDIYYLYLLPIAVCSFTCHDVNVSIYVA